MGNIKYAFFKKVFYSQNKYRKILKHLPLLNISHDETTRKKLRNYKLKAFIWRIYVCWSFMFVYMYCVYVYVYVYYMIYVLLSFLEDFIW